MRRRGVAARGAADRRSARARRESVVCRDTHTPHPRQERKRNLNGSESALQNEDPVRSPSERTSLLRCPFRLPLCPRCLSLLPRSGRTGRLERQQLIELTTASSRDGSRTDERWHDCGAGRAAPKAFNSLVAPVRN